MVSENDNVKLIKLTNGEELIAQVLADSADMVIIFPFCVVPLNTGSITLVPYTPFSDERVSIRGQHIITSYKPIDRRIVTQYTAAVAKYKDRFKESITGIITQINEKKELIR